MHNKHELHDLPIVRLCPRAQPSAQPSVRYLKEQAADQTIADKAFILELLVKNALDAREVKQFAASNRAAELLGREWDMFKGNLVLEDKREQSSLWWMSRSCQQVSSGRTGTSC